jgi:arylsulfatase A-like enzyme
MDARATSPCLLVILCLLVSLAPAAPGAPRPNIVYLLADDMGWKDLGCYGVTDIKTPRLDQLARQGVRFTRYYTNGPECTPTRAAFLTGRYQQRVGGLECAIGIGSVGRYDDAIRLAGQRELGLPVSELTLSRLLKTSGYATAICGKWHLGYEDKFNPNAHGFDYAFYATGGGMDYFQHVEDPPTYTPALRLNGKDIKRDGYFTDLIGDESVKWLKDRKAEAKPFFLYVPFTAPHAPYQGPNDASPKPLPENSDRWKQGKGSAEVYAAMVERLDLVVGRILDTLDSLGLAENTIVFFSSDNGGTSNARPMGIRGFKGTTFEGGIRAPLIVRWPGVLKPGTEYPHPAATFDLTTSIARAAGTQPPASRPFDGIDILKHVAANEPPPARDLFWRQRRGERTWRGVREGSLKLVIDTRGAEVEEFLFDLSTDDAEKSNLAKTRPTDLARLKAKLTAWEKEVKPTR